MHPYEEGDITPLEKDLKYDDCIFRTYTWPVPEGTVRKGTVLFVHGYRDYHGYYYQYAETLAKHGYEFFFFYQRGEGESRLVSGAKGVSNDQHAYKAIDDMVQYNHDKLIAENRKPILHLMGLSMGGGLTLNYACHGKLRSLITSFSAIAPLVTLHPDTYPGKHIELVVRAICSFSFGQNMRVTSPLKLDYLTSDEHMQEYIGSKVNTAGLDGAFVETRDFILRGRALHSKRVYSQIDKKVPLLIFHGDDDHINDVEGSKKFIDLVNTVPGMENKRIVVYPGARHVVVIEKPELRERLMEDVLQFLDEHSPQ